MMEPMTPLERFENNQRLVGAVVRNYKAPSVATYISREDLMQVGYIGLWAACNKFDPSRGVKFSTVAVPYIKGHLWRLFRDVNAKRRSNGNLVMSLDYQIEDEEGKSKELIDLIPSGFTDETSVDVERFVGRLSEKDKMIIILRMRGLKQREIADRVGTSQVQVARALKRIGQRYLEEHAG